jgi:hypothetical protein
MLRITLRTARMPKGSDRLDFMIWLAFACDALGKRHEILGAPDEAGPDSVHGAEDGQETQAALDEVEATWRAFLARPDLAPPAEVTP